MKQLSFFEEFDSSSVSILDLLKEHVDISELIPYSFASAFYSHNGRDRRYSLRSLISAFLLQKLLTIPTTELLINLLKISKELRDFKKIIMVFLIKLSFQDSKHLLQII